MRFYEHISDWIFGCRKFARYTDKISSLKYNKTCIYIYIYSVVILLSVKYSYDTILLLNNIAMILIAGTGNLKLLLCLVYTFII